MTSKHTLAIWFGAIIAALVVFAATYPRWSAAPAATPPAISAQTSAALPSSAATSAEADPRSWAKLTLAEQEALAPLAGQWDSFTDQRKLKWLKIAARYPRMSPSERERLHARMTEWMHFSPEQRRIARENYQLSKRLPVAQRESAWHAYQQLPEDQKKKLAASERKNRRPTVVSAPPVVTPGINLKGVHGQREHEHGHANGSASKVVSATPASTSAVPAHLPGAAAAGSAPSAPNVASTPASAASNPASTEHRVVPLLEQTLH